MKAIFALIIILAWPLPVWAQTGGEPESGQTPGSPNYSVPPLPPSVRPITPDNPAGPAEPRPRMVPPSASNDFEPPPETVDYTERRRSPEDQEAYQEAVEPSWHTELDLPSAEEAAIDDLQLYESAQTTPVEEEVDDPALWEPAAERYGTEERPADETPDLPVEETRASSFEELLTEKEGVEFEYEGTTYVWRDGVPFEKTGDGSLMALEPPEDLYVVGDDGRQWLSRNADGDVYINVAPRIWATINFAHNSDIIEEDSKPVLDVFGESLNSAALNRHRLIIAGHTSRTGNPEYNVKLSRRRALSVSRYLIERHGIEPGRLILHGYGFERPIADNETEEGQAINRRVEFILLGPGTDE